MIILCGLAILFWWRARLKKSYIEAELKRNYEARLQALTEQVQTLEQSNQEMSALIHRDNRLIPAMMEAVQTYLDSGQDRETGEDLLRQLEGAFQDRRIVLRKQKDPLPTTHVKGIDDLLAFLRQKAEDSGVSLELTVSNSAQYLIQYLLPEMELKTVLADMIENARIAASPSGRIYVRMGIREGCYGLDVLDSGVPFPEKVLCSLGKERTTGHPQDGGTGIGLMTLWETAKKHNASIVIEEFPENTAYTKRVSFQLDGLGRYCVKTTPERQKILREARQEAVLL